MEFASVLPLWQILLLAIISFFVGVLGGFVGLALGTLRLPCLLLMGVSPSIAAGTNILVSMLSALVGSYRHILERRVNWRLVALMGGPAALGSFVGGFASSAAIPEGALILVAGMFVSWQAVEFWWRQRRPAAVGPGASSYTSASARVVPPPGVIEATAGMVVGLIGGAVGLILGSVRLPIIIRLLGVDPRIAAGSNLVIGSFMGAFGFIGHGIQGEVDVPILGAMGLSGMAGTYTGARLTGRVSLNTLLTTMSGILLVVGILLIRDGVSR